MTQHDDHGPEGLAADLPYLTRRRLVLTGLALGGAAASLWAAGSGAATVTVDTWRDGAGREVATVTRAYTGGAWRVRCDGAEHVVDPESPACQADPWVRNRNPHALPCPIDTEACRER